MLPYDLYDLNDLVRISWLDAYFTDPAQHTITTLYDLYDLHDLDRDLLHVCANYQTKILIRFTIK